MSDLKTGISESKNLFTVFIGLLKVINENVLFSWKIVYGLAPEARMLIISQFIYAFGQTLGGLFINVFLLRQTSDLGLIVGFNLVQFPGIFIGYLFTILVPIKARSFVRLGFLLQIAAYAATIFLNENAPTYIWLSGVIFGLSMGTYWGGNNAMVYIFTKDTNRGTFYGINFSMAYLIAVIAPLCAGTIIAQNFFPEFDILLNYYILFGFASFIFAIGIIFSQQLPIIRMSKIRVMDVLELYRYKNWRLIAYSYFIEGFRVGTEVFVASLLLFYLLSAELNMGIYQSFFSLLSALLSLKLAKWIKATNRFRYLFLGSILVLIASIIYALWFSLPSLFLSLIIFIVAMPIYNISVSPIFFGVMDKIESNKEDFNKYIFFREGPSHAGRFVGTLLLFGVLTVFNDHLAVIRGWYIFLAFIPLVFAVLIHEFQKSVQ